MAFFYLCIVCCCTRSHTMTHTLHKVGLLWTSDQLVVETSIWRHTTLTIDRRPQHRRGFKPATLTNERSQTDVLDGAATRIGCTSNSLSKLHKFLSFWKPCFHERRKWRVLRSGQGFSTCLALQDARVVSLANIVILLRILITRLVYCCLARIWTQTAGNEGFGLRKEFLQSVSHYTYVKWLFILKCVL